MSLHTTVSSKKCGEEASAGTRSCLLNFLKHGSTGVRKLPQIHQITIPRWYGADKRQGEQSQILCVFTNASEKAYGVVAYLQGETVDGDTDLAGSIQVKSGTYQNHNSTKS